MLSAHPHNEPNSEFADRIEGLQVLLGELEGEQGCKGVPTEEEIKQAADRLSNGNSNYDLNRAHFVYGAQWYRSQMQPESTKHVSDMSVDDFNLIFGDNWVPEYIRKKVVKFSSINEFHNLLNTIGDFRSYTKAKELGYDVEFSLPQPPTK